MNCNEFSLKRIKTHQNNKKTHQNNKKTPQKSLN